MKRLTTEAIQSKNQMVGNTLHRAGNHVVSIGIDGHQLAIMSAHTGDWVGLERAKTNKRLRKVKRVFKSNLCCWFDFFFEHMTQEDILKVINILKGK